MKQNAIKYCLGYNKKKPLNIRDCRSENRLKEEDREISQEENKEVKRWKSEEKYMSSREPIKEIQHANNISSRKRKMIGGPCPRNHLRKIFTTEGHIFSDQKGLEKWMNVDPHQDAHTWNSKYKKKIRKHCKFQKGRRKKRSHTRDEESKSFQTSGQQH